ncbi:hypothetical protein MLD38_001143 [Melastoma candidum]|uniref:Uncharacterized protein n=1 Tax=Melastoma candidum TaxID=119954 RepID=A0ACB9SD94_9MYRT|nr:hypothetical protein MLD38_001143 [Melastoma candidum]
MSGHEESSRCGEGHRKYAGVRQRKWGKWVSEIRVPGTQERLWLGSYSSPEGAAIAHDVAMYCLRGPSASDKLNFPLQRMPSVVFTGDMSLQSVQKAASDAGMAVDASFVASRSVQEDGGSDSRHGNARPDGGDGCLSISVDDYL